MLSLEDLNQFFLHCVVMYKNKPVRVRSISRDKKMGIVDLATGKFDTVTFDERHFKPPPRGIGMVNCFNAAVYLTRIPVRLYMMGWRAENTKVKEFSTIYPEGRGETLDRLKTFECPEIAEAVFGKYPTFKKALEKAKATNGVFAFDRQFAIDFKGNIYYKFNKVGMIKPPHDKIEDIVWDEGREYLKVLLDGNHEKDLRDFCVPCR